MPVFTRENITSQDLSCDVCIIGSGAGGATLAAGLAEKGFDVIMLEAGEYDTQKDFDMNEAKSFQRRYQEKGLRSTDDLSITILQGTGVGGSTTINWTSCFRTPKGILALWQERHGVDSLSEDILAPHFEAVEKRLSIQTWSSDLINENNQTLWRGAKKLGWEVAPLRRNVLGCMNSGYCGMGCPANAKQGMLLTYIPDALDKGMRLYANTKADKLIEKNGKIVQIEASVMGTDQRFKIKPKICVSACGAINGPALFLKSGINDHGLVGKRTFLHPVVGLAAIFADKINGWYGAPQSVSSHQFIDRGADKIGFFLEHAPTHPVLAATAASGFGISQQRFMQNLYRASFVLALHVDGILDADQGGAVTVGSNGRVYIHYPISAALKEGFQESMKRMIEVSLAAGAEDTMTLHTSPIHVAKMDDISKLDSAEYGALKHGIFSAHQMGGLAMGGDPRSSVVNPYLQHHRINNLFVVDGSVFPTALGVNPSESIYGLAHWARESIAQAI